MVLSLAAVFLACAVVSPVIVSSAAESIDLPVVTIPMQGDRLRLVITGDTGGDPSRVARAIRSFHQQNPVDAIVLLGDNFYSCGVRSEADPQWRKVRDNFSPIGVPILPVLGNHDYGNPKGSGTRVVICGNPDPEAQVRVTGRVPNWKFPARSYQVRTPVAELFLIDTTPLARQWTRSVLGGSSSRAILDALSEALAQSKARWRIVAGHHTIRASGEHGWDDPQGEGHMSRVLRMLLERNVDAYLAGHDHHMELISFEDTDPRQPIYLISGAGSRPRKIIPKSRTRLPTLFPPDARSFLGFAVLEISADSLSISFFDTTPRRRGETFTFSH